MPLVSCLEYCVHKLPASMVQTDESDTGQFHHMEPLREESVLHKGGKTLAALFYQLVFQLEMDLVSSYSVLAQ